MNNETKITIAIPAAWDDKTWGKNLSTLKKSFAPGSKLMVLLADSAVQALLHAYNHGDPFRCEQLYVSVGESTGAIRGESMKEWFRVMSGEDITSALNKDKKRVWKMKKGWSKDNFKLEDALSKPFWEFMGAEVTKFTTGLSLLQSIHATVKKAENAFGKNTFKGDYTKVKDALSKISSFADTTFKPLTKLELGEVDPIESVDPSIVPSAGKAVSQHPTVN